ncbi:transposase [Desulforapulum autotrophicum]|uniref:transposase n=1 Tax=Desulforapulum autotrophicum TaxID=2296 RepID=UPI0002EAC4A6
MKALKSFQKQIRSIFPKTEVKFCVVYQIRNSLRYVGSKNQKQFRVDLNGFIKRLTRSGRI